MSIEIDESLTVKSMTTMMSTEVTHAGTPSVIHINAAKAKRTNHHGFNLIASNNNPVDYNANDVTFVSDNGNHALFDDRKTGNAEAGCGKVPQKERQNDYSRDLDKSHDVKLRRKGWTFFTGCFHRFYSEYLFS